MNPDTLSIVAEGVLTGVLLLVAALVLVALLMLWLMEVNPWK